MEFLKRRIAEALQNQILRQSLLKHGIRQKYADYFVGAQRLPSKTVPLSHKPAMGGVNPPIICDSKRVREGAVRTWRTGERQTFGRMTVRETLKALGCQISMIFNGHAIKNSENVSPKSKRVLKGRSCGGRPVRSRLCDPCDGSCQAGGLLWADVCWLVRQAVRKVIRLSMRSRSSVGGRQFSDFLPHGEEPISDSSRSVGREIRQGRNSGHGGLFA